MEACTDNAFTLITILVNIMLNFVFFGIIKKKKSEMILRGRVIIP